MPELHAPPPCFRRWNPSGTSAHHRESTASRTKGLYVQLARRLERAGAPLSWAMSGTRDRTCGDVEDASADVFSSPYPAARSVAGGTQS